MSPYLKMLIFLTLGLLAVFGWHFATVFGYLGTAPQTQTGFFIRIGFILVGFILASFITAFLIAKQNENAVLPDEREEKIELKTERVGILIIYIGLLLVAWFVFTPMTPIQVANAILAVVCISEFVKIIYGLFIIKRGF